MRWRLPGGKPGPYVAALCLYAIWLVALAPATLLDVELKRTTHGRLRLPDARGSLWGGAGQLELRDPSGRAGVGIAMHWTFQPSSLLRGRLGFAVAFADATRRFPVSLSPFGLELSAADFLLPAAILGVATPRMALLEPTGELRVRIPILSYRGDVLSGHGIVDWMSAGSALTPVAPLGDYQLKFVGAAHGLHASLRTISGPLRLDGGASRTDDGPMLLFATARVDAQHEEQLAPFLRLIAIPRSAGIYELQLHQFTDRPAIPRPVGQLGGAVQ
jgi:general secretion pathway protein N